MPKSTNYLFHFFLLFYMNMPMVIIALFLIGAGIFIQYGLNTQESYFDQEIGETERSTFMNFFSINNILYLFSGILLFLSFLTVYKTDEVYHG